MEIEYSKHLKQRLTLRKIEYDLPKKIFEQSNERYFDEETGYFIATMQADIYNKTREIMIAYMKEGDYAKILTIHPLKEGQKENRVESGRWRKINERI
jgi:tRNA(Ile)-lysidine synthase TilS/MesJ